MSTILSWLVNALALFLTVKLVPGISVSGLPTLLIAALVIGLVNAFIKPVAQLLALPITIVTFGLFALVINAAMLAFAAWIVPGFNIAGFWSAFFGAIVLSLISTILHQLLIKNSDKPKP
jgi:putative membrane protein